MDLAILRIIDNKGKATANEIIVDLKENYDKDYSQGNGGYIKIGRLEKKGLICSQEGPNPIKSSIRSKVKYYQVCNYAKQKFLTHLEKNES